MNNISENLFSAIDIIVQKRLAQLPYDKTLLCTVVNDAKKYNGNYSVKYDNLIFEAYSEKADYAIGDQVYVTFPENNNLQQRVIIGKYIAPKIVSASVNPEDNLIIYGQKTIEEDIPNYEIHNNQTVLNSLLFESEFKPNKNTTSYFTILVQYRQGQNSKFVITESDIFGTTSGQTRKVKKLFVLTQNSPISAIRILNSNVQSFVKTTYTLGNSLSDYLYNIEQDDVILLKTLDSLEYTESNEEKQIFASWIHKNDNGVYVKQQASNSWEWQSYQITEYNDVSMDSAWVTINNIGTNKLTISTNTKYPYQRYRLKIGNFVSEPLTFNNKSWEGKNSFDVETESLAYYLHLSLINMNDEIGGVDVFTKGNYNYQLNMELKDLYTNTIVQNNLTDVKLEYLLKENFEEYESGFYRLEDAAAPGYGIIKATVVVDGIEYVGYCSIGWRADPAAAIFTGPKMVTYNQLGANPEYNKAPFGITGYDNLVWETNKLGLNDENNYPKIINTDGNYFLKPLNIYIKGLPNNFYVQAKQENQPLWIQPIGIVTSGEPTSALPDDEFQLSSTAISLGYLTEGSEAISGLFIGTDANGKPGIFSLLNGKLNFLFAVDEVQLGGWDDVRKGEEVKDYSYIKSSYQENGENVIISNGYGNHEIVNPDSEQIAETGFKINLSKDEFISKFFSLNNDISKINIGGCRLVLLNQGTEQEKIVLEILSDNIVEKLYGTENIDNSDSSKDSWLITYSYIKTLENKIAELDQKIQDLSAKG